MREDLTHTESDLVQRLANGDQQAFTVVYKRLYASVYLYAERLTARDSAFSQDATAEAFIELWKGDRQFDDLRHVANFLRKVVHHKCVDMLRHRSRDMAYQQELAHLGEQYRQEQVFEEMTLRANLLALIRQEIEKLPKHTSSVFKLAFFEKRKNAEIALLLNITDATVRRRKTEALHFLRKRLKGIDWDLVIYVLALSGWTR